VKVGDLVQYKQPARSPVSGRVGTIIALRPLHDYDEYPYWAEVRYTENIHRAITCKVTNLKVISQ